MHLDAVNHDLDVVGLVAVHHHAELDLAQFSIHAHAGEACLTDVFEQLAVVTFAATDGGGQDVDTLAIKLLEDEVGDLLFGVAHHALAGVVGIGLADAGVEQAQEVVDLGDGAHGGTRVLVHALLLDADDGAEASDLVDVGAFHVAYELSRVGREALHVTALSLGINRVEGQRRLAAPADARDDHEGVARHGEVDVLEVVLASTEDL